MNRRLLNKSGFKSFFKNKVGATLLALIVLLSAITFTTLQSTISNYSYSYNHLVVDGNLHKYTMKENYSVNGTIKYKAEAVPHAGPDRDGVQAVSSIYTGNVHNDPAVLIGKTNSQLIVSGLFDPLFSNMAINLSSITSLDSDADGLIDDVQLLPGTTNIQFYVVPTMSPEDPVSFTEFLDTTPTSVTIDTNTGKITDTVTGATFNNVYTFPNAPFTTQLKWDTGANNFKKIILDSISNAQTTQKTSLALIKMNDFVVKPNPSHTTLDYLSEYNSNKSAYEKLFKNINVADIDSKTGATTSSVLLDGITLLKDKFNQKIIESKSQNFKSMITNEVKAKYQADLLTKDVRSFDVSSSGESYKLVNDEDTAAGINKLVMYSGARFQSSKTNEIENNLDANGKNAIDRLKDEILVQHPDAVSFSVNMDEKWRYSVHFFIGPIPRVKSIIDASSYEAVISPSFASARGITPIDREILNSKEIQDAIEGEDVLQIQKLASTYKNHVVMVGSVLYFVTGIGITPDFAYPIISNKQPVVNVNEQAVVYLNDAGYRRCHQSFPSSNTENYVSLSFKQDLSSEKQQEIAEYIESRIHDADGMNFSSNIRVISRYDDTSEKIILAPQRISFLSKLKNTIMTISGVTIAGLLLLTALVVIITTKRTISSEKRTLTIMHANGYSKFSIALSYILPSLILVGISTIIGYIIGLSLQPAMIHIFRNFWTIPMDKVHFSWISLFVIVLVPLLSIGLLIILIVLSQLRGNVVENMRGKDGNISQQISAKVLSMIKFAGTKTKIAVSYFFTNIGNMFLILFATTIGVVAVSTGLTVAGKFEYAISETEKINKYEFAVDLADPSQEGGQYTLAIAKDPSSYQGKWTQNDPQRVWLGMQGIKNNYIDKAADFLNGNTSGTLGSIGNEQWLEGVSYTHVPGASDATSQKLAGWGSTGDTSLLKYATHYMEGKVQSKALLNIRLGAAGDTPVNPWDINKQLMPSNQQNLADKDYINYLWRLHENPTVKSNFSTVAQIKAYDNESNSSYADKNANWYKTIENLHNATTPAEIRRFEKQMSFDISMVPASQIYAVRDSFVKTVEVGYKNGIYPFVLAYNQITSDVNDEAYTSIKGTTTLHNVAGSNAPLTLSIKGIKEHSNYIVMGDSAYNKIQTYTGKNIPIVINKFMHEFYKLNNGSTFKMDVNNKYDRFITGKKTESMTFEVVDIVNSYENNDLFTSKSIANRILGLDARNGFNGIFTDQKEPSVLKNINLYSQSGMYIAQSSFNPNDSNDENTELIGKYLKSSQNNTNVDKDIVSFNARYGNVIYQSTIGSVKWAQMEQFTFESINNLSSSLIVLVEGIILIIAVIFIIILGTIMVRNNMKNIAVMKVMGYRDSEIKSSFIKSFIPSLILASIFAIPIVFTILLAMKIAIMSFGSLLIPLNMLGWEIPVAAVIVTTVFLSIFLGSIRGIGQQKALDAFKE